MKVIVSFGPARAAVVCQGDERYVCIAAEKEIRDAIALGTGCMFEVNGDNAGARIRTVNYLCDVSRELALDRRLASAGPN